jgi:hypothetical protein
LSKPFIKPVFDKLTASPETLGQGSPFSVPSSLQFLLRLLT